MERVKKGERYWYISLKDGSVRYANELYLPINNTAYSIGNYFLTEEEAESMARKLRAVLQGADVIEMPSRKEFYKVAPSTDKLGGYSLENSRQIRGF